MSTDVANSSGYFISAPWRSSGKTIFTIGLARAAMQQKVAVQTFKKGPDYIDPLWLSAASGVGCYNIDPYIQQHSQWQQTFINHVHEHTLALMEGTMGLHDGLQGDGSDSNASVASALELPVILVVDCRGMHRTVAALINGIQQFDPEVQFAGVVLNRIRSSRHEEKISAALEQHSDVRLLGTLPDSPDAHIDEKQLGLTPVTELTRVNAFIENAAELVTKNCDLDYLFSGVAVSDEIQRPVASKDSHVLTTESSSVNPVKVGIARDNAFHFYYQDDLDAFTSMGVELVPVSPISDSFPSDLDGLIIGGGFPERHARALADNQNFRSGLRAAIDKGLVVHAECAGLMYLCNRLVLDEGSFDMVGAIDGEVKMCAKPQGRGYMKLQQRRNETEIRAHEFHHSEIQFRDQPESLFKVLRGHGIDGHSDGVVYHNVQASYAHFRQTEQYPWVEKFIRRVTDNVSAR